MSYSIRCGPTLRARAHALGMGLVLARRVRPGGVGEQGRPWAGAEATGPEAAVAGATAAEGPVKNPFSFWAPTHPDGAHRSSARVRHPLRA